MALIHTKLIAIMSEIGAIAKDTKSKDSGINYAFRGVDDVYNKLHPLFCKHGVFLTQSILASDSMFFTNANGKPVNKASITLEVFLHAEDGKESVKTAGYGEAYDHSDKASYKAQSMAMKYALIQMFMIPTQEVKDVEHSNIEPVKTYIRDAEMLDLIASINTIISLDGFDTTKKAQVKKWLLSNPNKQKLQEMENKLLNINNS